jgi:hypothetical protein
MIGLILAITVAILLAALGANRIVFGGWRSWPWGKAAMDYTARKFEERWYANGKTSNTSQS